MTYTFMWSSIFLVYFSNQFFDVDVLFTMLTNDFEYFFVSILFQTDGIFFITTFFLKN